MVFFVAKLSIISPLSKANEIIILMSIVQNHLSVALLNENKLSNCLWSLMSLVSFSLLFRDLRILNRNLTRIKVAGIMDQSKKKRERGANYTPEEKSLLADLVCEYKHIIEDKRTSGMFLARKKEGWLKIASKFNSCASSGHRSVEQLKMLYDNWKQKTRKKMAENNIQIHKTGGGSYQTKTIDDDDKILSIIQDQTKPLRNPFDSGAAYFKDIDNLHTFQNQIGFGEEESAEKSIVIEELEIQEVIQNNKNSKTTAKRDVHRIIKNKKYLSAESFKRIYFKRKCQVAYLEKKKLMQDILQQKQQHNLKMQILKLKLSKMNSIIIL